MKTKKISQQHKLITLGSLTAGVIHDLNNIFTSSYMHLALLELNIKDPELKEHLTSIHDDIERASQLSSKIMSFLREEKQSDEPINPFDCLNNISSLLKKALGKKISFSITLPEEFYLINTSHSDIYQIIMNLIINAKDANPKTVSLDCSYKEIEEQLFFIIKVEDDGIGIPEKDIENIFTPFFSTKPSTKGTGLGLNIILDILQKIQGYIKVSSIEKKKTSFNIFIPAQK